MALGYILQLGRGEFYRRPVERPLPLLVVQNRWGSPPVFQESLLSAANAGADAVVMVVTGFERFSAGASVRSINAALESGMVEFA